MKMLRYKTIASSLVACPIFISLKSSTCRAFTQFSLIHHKEFFRSDRTFVPPIDNNNNKHYDNCDIAVNTKRFFSGTVDDSNNDISSSSTKIEVNRSVTGVIYPSSSEEHPIVTLYTKEGCTLCDKVSDILRSVRYEYPHSLNAVDITDSDKSNYWDMYKWDIPVLHVNGMYWTKHRLTVEEASEALQKACEGTFIMQDGEPDAGAMERRQAERRG